LAERSTLINSVAAQEFGADDTDLYDVRGVGIDVDFGSHFGLEWRIVASRETQRALSVHATPSTGRYGATTPALPLQATRASLTVDHAESGGPAGLSWRAHGEVRGEWLTAADTALSGPVTVGRAFLALDASQRLSQTLLAARVALGGVVADGLLPPQEEVYAGGPFTGPGYPFHAFVGRLTGSVHGEWQLRVPAPGISLGRLGTTPREFTLAPFVSADYVDRAAPFRPLASGLYPAVGIGGLAIFNLLRVDVARGLRAPGCWTLSIDISRDWWGVL
jgi:hypothetical protein